MEDKRINVPRDNYEKRLEVIRKEQFDRALRNPSDWFMTALSLRSAANALQDGPLDKHPDDVIRTIGTFTTAVYRFLIARSMENLIKGIVIAQGENLGSNGVMHGKFKNHNLVSLCGHLKKIGIDKDDRKIMEVLSVYAQWLGDYPIPLNDNDYTPRFIGLPLVESKMLDLWDRLADHLHKTGWSVASDGKTKIPLDRLAPDLLKHVRER